MLSFLLKQTWIGNDYFFLNFFFLFNFGTADYCNFRFSFGTAGYCWTAG